MYDVVAVVVAVGIWPTCALFVCHKNDHQEACDCIHCIIISKTEITPKGRLDMGFDVNILPKLK